MPRRHATKPLIYISNLTLTLMVVTCLVQYQDSGFFEQWREEGGAGGRLLGSFSGGDLDGGVQGSEMTLERLRGRVTDLEQQLSVVDDVQDRLKVTVVVLLAVSA